MNLFQRETLHPSEIDLVSVRSYCCLPIFHTSCQNKSDQAYNSSGLFVKILGVGNDRQHKIFIKKIGLRLRELRNERNWTLEETEEHGWTSWQHLQKLESGKKDMNLSTIFRLSKLYKVHPSEILRYD